MLHPFVLAVFKACCLKLQLRFEISSNTWLGKLGSLSKLKKLLFTLRQILMFIILNLTMRINLETLVFNKLMCLLFYAIIVNLLVMKCDPVHYLMNIDALEYCITDMMWQFFGIQYRECYNDLPVTGPSLGYPMPNDSLVDDFEPFLPQRPNVHVDKPFANLREENDTPISLCVSPLEPRTPRDIANDVLIFSDPPNPLSLSCKFKDGERLRGDANSEEHSLDEPFDVESSEVSPHIELTDPFSDESSPDLGLIAPILSLSSPLPPFLPSIDPLESTFIDSDFCA